MKIRELGEAHKEYPARELDEWLEDSPMAFGRFYAEVFERECPRHAMEEWVEPLYAAREEDKGLVIEAFRGSSKTTIVAIGWLAFQIGLKPHRSYMLVQVGDELAKDTVQEIADLIEYKPGWRMVFPDVEAGRKAGRSSRGYEVKRTDIDYEDWRQLCANEKGKDPTLVGMGYKSRAIIRRHPTVTMDTWKVAIGTPWRRDDVLAYLKGTGEFKSVKTPAIRKNESGIRNGDNGRNSKTRKKSKLAKVTRNFGEGIWTATWRDGLPLSDVEKQRRILGEVEFAPMYLLDLEAASGVHLRSDGSNQKRLTFHPADDAQPTWSQDGTQIGFMSARPSPVDLPVRNFDTYLLTTASGDVKKVTEYVGLDGPTVWSPDGKLIAIGSQREGGQM